jgi:hypothetical protein
LRGGSWRQDGCFDGGRVVRRFGRLRAFRRGRRLLGLLNLLDRRSRGLHRFQRRRQRLLRLRRVGIPQLNTFRERARAGTGQDQQDHCQQQYSS